MTEEQPVAESNQVEAKSGGGMGPKLSNLGWGLFFVWIGISLMIHVSPGAALLGVGVITLAVQIARRIFGLKIEGFWLFIGLLFFLGALWDLIGAEFDLVAVLLIVAGVAILVSAVVRKT